MKIEVAPANKVSDRRKEVQVTVWSDDNDEGVCHTESVSTASMEFDEIFFNYNGTKKAETEIVNSFLVICLIFLSVF